jgi:two-component system OmpR family sensor kinase
MVKGDDFVVTARPASLVQVFDNLIHNASMWLNTANEQKRLIGIEIDSNNNSVLISDNGPGVPEHLRDQIFEAFVTMRNGGRGLGLYITQELLSAMKANISLTDPPPWANSTGASFLIEFPDNVE